MMVDLENTIVPKSDQLNADDFLTGPKTIKITGVKATNGDQPVSIFFEGDSGKPFKPCKSMRRVLIQIWGGDGDSYVGKSMTLYNDPTVKWAGKEVGGIRISHMSHMEEPKSIMLTIRKAVRQIFRVKVLEFKREMPKPLAKLSDDDLTLWSDKIKATKTKDELIAISREINSMGLEADEKRIKLLEVYNETMNNFK